MVTYKSVDEKCGTFSGAIKVMTILKLSVG